MSSKEVVSVGVPLISDEDDEFQEIWRKVQKSVHGIKRIEDFKFTPDKDIGPADVQKLLDNSQDNSEKARKKRRGQSTKQIFDRILECIQNLGGIAAGTASYAIGGPANLCYNALTFVIVVYQSYSGMLASLAHLLGKFVGFFGRLDNYRDAPMIDRKLRKVAMKQLHLFVKICTYTLKLRRSKKFQAKTAMKIFFFKEDGMQPLLQEMEDLQTQEFGLVGAATLVIAGQLQVALGNLSRDLTESLVIHFGNVITQKAIDQAEPNKEKEIKWRRETLIEVLMWPLDDLIVGLDEKVPRCVWESSWQRYVAKETTEGTGRWLDSCKVFQDWAEGKTSDTTVFGIEGAEGTGKTQLVANIIARLRDMHGKSAPIAYYFLEPDSKAGAASKVGVRATVTRSLIWQLAESYSPFFKSASDICTKHHAIHDPLDMWKKTLVNNTDFVGWNTTFFIILDGLVGHDHAKFFRELLQLLRKSSIENREKNLGLQSIKLGRDNIKDIELYINQRLNQMDLMQDLSNVDVSELRKKIIESLKMVTAGDYRKIDTVLTEISEKDDSLQIDNCLKQAGTAAANQMITTIQTINLTSSPNEISDMNEMMIWVMNGRSRLTPPQLEGALSLKDGNSTTPAPDGERRTLFRSLESRIRVGKYPIFKLTSAEEEIVVTFVGATNIEDAKKRILEANERSDDGNVQNFHQAEVRMIKHYLRTVCPSDVYDKFGFEDFLSKKLPQTRISLNSGNAEITLALRSLQCLVDVPTEVTVLLHSYAADHLYSHLYRAEHGGDSLKGPEKQGHLSLTNRDLRTQVGVLLVKLLTKKTEPFSNASRVLTSKTSMDPEHDFWNPKIERVARVAAWSSQNFATKKSTSTKKVWKAHLALILLRLYLNENKNVSRKAVEKSAREACDTDDKNWKALYTLAQVTESRDEATEILEKITENLSAKKAWTDDLAKRRVLAEMYLELGDKFWFSTSSEMQDRAIAAYTESIKMDTSYTQRYLGVISRFTNKTLWKNIASLLEMLLEGPSKASGAPIGNLILAEDDSRSLDDSITRTAEALGRWDLVKKVYKEGINSAHTHSN
ncbi:hypothetical protein CSPX01_07574 [Colletotrichum filicis]|nr:hypothetical protein CSPX01_07574 [Colletotrichum filicis]